MLNDRKFIVFAIEHYNPLGVIRSLGEMGISPIYIAEKGKTQLASKSKYTSKCHYVDTVVEGYSLLLSEYGNEETKPYLITTDDHTLGYLDDRYEEWKGKFISFNAGCNGGINKYVDKAEILRLAKKCGLGVADTVVVERGEIPEALEFPIITKSISPNVGGWKSDVFICKSREDLKTAYTKIKAPRLLLQKYIDKKNELEYYGFAINQGKDVMISIAADYLYLIPGYYSPYMNVFNPPYLEIQEKVASMIREVGFEGIFSCEFVRDADDNLYFLEINFRNATWSYSSTKAGMNLPYLWAESMERGCITAEAKKSFEPFRAMVEPIDYAKRVDTRKVSLAEWISDFRNAKCTYYYNEDDIEPYKVLYEDWEKLK